MRPLRVLLLSHSFPPGRGSGVYRARAWANELARRGHEVCVVTVDPSYYPLVTGAVDEALTATVDPTVRRQLVRVPRQHLVQDVLRMSWAHASFPELHASFWRGAARRCFPEIYGLAHPVMTLAGLKTGLRGRPDLVVATGNPYAQMAAGRRLSRLFRAPLLLDFHDGWTLNQFSGADNFPPHHPAWTWEQRLFDAARWVVTVNEPLASWFRARYPTAAQRVRVVANGFAEDVVPDLGYAPHRAGAPLRFGYVGTIRSDLPLEQLRAGWRLARQDPLLRDATFDYVGYLGFFAQAGEAIASRLGRGEDGITYSGPVSQTQLAATYRDLDVLALLTPSSPYVTAGKVFDYMAAGRPVVGVHAPSNDTTTALGGFPLFTGVASLSPEAIASALVRAARQRLAMDASTYDACRAHAVAHNWESVLQPVLTEVETSLDA